MSTKRQAHYLLLSRPASLSSVLVTWRIATVKTAVYSPSHTHSLTSCQQRSSMRHKIGTLQSIASNLRKFHTKVDVCCLHVKFILISTSLCEFFCNFSCELNGIPEALNYEIAKEFSAPQVYWLADASA